MINRNYSYKVTTHLHSIHTHTHNIYTYKMNANEQTIRRNERKNLLHALDDDPFHSVEIETPFIPSIFFFRF